MQPARHAAEDLAPARGRKSSCPTADRSTSFDASLRCKRPVAAPHPFKRGLRLRRQFGVKRPQVIEPAAAIGAHLLVGGATERDERAYFLPRPPADSCWS
jgi:hypothetical protein